MAAAAAASHRRSSTSSFQSESPTKSAKPGNSVPGQLRTRRKLHHADAAGPARMHKSDGGSPITPTPQDPPERTGAMEESPSRQRRETRQDRQERWGKPHHSNASGPTKMDGNDGGSPITPTPQDPPRWTVTMGKAPACRRLRIQLNGQGL